MADETTDKDKPPRPRQPERRRRLSPGTTTPYYVAALFLAAAMAWYLLLFVPSKLEYFVGVRSRALAVASNQVKVNIENLVSAYSTAPRCDIAQHPNSDTNLYLRVLVPQIRISRPGALRTPGLELDVADPADCPAGTSAAVRPTVSVSWADVMAQARDLTLTDFDDLILATQNGDVVWQREETTPRIGNLAQVLYSDSAGRGWLSFNWSATPEIPKHDAPSLPRATASKPVSIGGRSVLLLVQSIPLPRGGFTLADIEAPLTAQKTAATDNEPASPTLFVAGVVSSTTLQSEAMHVPLAWVILLSLPVILLFLALPFVKLATLTPRERFRFADVVVLLVAAFVIVSIAATMPFGITAIDDELDQSLQAFAEELNDRMIQDVRQVLTFGSEVHKNRPEIEKSLRPCLVKVADFPQNRCSLWSAISGRLPGVQTGKLDVDVIIWLDRNGLQVEKWTSKVQLTGRTTHAGFQHFRDLGVSRHWRVVNPAAATNLPPFVIEPLRAPTTADLGVLIAFPVEDSPQSAAFVALNVRLPSVLDTVTPPGYGFAVIGPDGKVMFHSSENRTLHENFFQEVGEPADVRRRVRSGHLMTWNGEYHGRPHRIHLRPLSNPVDDVILARNGANNARFEGSPWQIVTFRELNPVLASITAHQNGTIRLIGVNLAILALAAVFVAIFTKSKERNIGDLFNVRNVCQPIVLWLLGVLVAMAVVALVLTPRVPARDQLDRYYVFFAALPMLAFVVSAAARRLGSRDESAPRDPGLLVRAELGLLVLLVAALPAAGLTRVVSRVQEIDRAGHWLEETQRRISERNTRVLARVNGPSFDGSTQNTLTSTGFANTSALSQYAYLAGEQVDTTVAPLAGKPDSGQRLVRFLLGWNPFPSRDSTGHPSITADAHKFRLDPLVPGSPALVIADRSNARPASFSGPTSYSLPLAKLLFGIVLFTATIAALYWARRKLLSHPPIDTPTIDTVLRSLPDKGSHGVLMIGPPRTNKDRIVVEAVGAKHRFPSRRIALLESVADAAFVTQELAALESADPRLWIHVSNLETHLVEPERRRFALHLLDRLLVRRQEDVSRTVIVTTTVDPIAHFDEIFEKEREGIYRDAIPEVELSRLSLLLTRFHRCYIRIGAAESADPWWDYDPKEWKNVLKWETAPSALKYVGADLSNEWSEREQVSRAELLAAVNARSFAIYQLLWTTCTRREKLALVQLAQEGFVTPRSKDIVTALMAKGIVVLRPGPAIFNESFRTFLRTIERSEVVTEWERVGGHGLWWVAGRLVISSVVAGGLFFLLTQGYSVEALLPVLSGTGLFGVPLVRSLIARLSGTSQAAATA